VTTALEKHVSAKPSSPPAGTGKKHRAGPIPVALRLKPGELPITIKRLLELKQGESFRYYLGSLADAESESTPLYAALLHRVFATANRLEKQGRVTLSKVKVASKQDDPTGRLACFAFSATGLRHD
jgi:hypothetical protein